jgi:hypothetical protein
MLPLGQGAPESGEMRAIIHYIRNKIIPEKAEKVLKAESTRSLPDSYRKLFWLDANRNGYMPTQDTRKVIAHIKSLQSRVDAIQENIDSAYLVLAALEKLKQ